MPEIYMIFVRNMPEFYTTIARKIFSQILGARDLDNIYLFHHEDSIKKTTDK